MTYEQMIPEFFMSVVLGTISVVIEFLMVFNILMICRCFFLRDIKINKKQFILPGIYMVLRLGLAVAVSVGFLIEVHNNPSAIFVLDLVSPASKIVNLVNKLALVAAIIYAAGMAYSRHRLLHGIETYIILVVVETYMQTIAMFSQAFNSEDIPGYLFQDMNGLATENTGYNIAYFTLAVAIFAAMYFGMYRKGNSMYIRWRYRILFLAWELTLIMSVMVPVDRDTTKTEMYTIMGRTLGVIYPILGIAVPILIVLVISRKNIMEKNLLQENYIAAELEYISQYKKSQEETRAFRHDVINNLSLLSSMIKNDKNKEADAYLEEMLGEVCAMSPKYITGDEMLDCLVGMKVSRMEQSGIKFTLDGVADGGLGMKPAEICSIFANALDNAIEACERADEDNRLIKFQIKKSGQFFNIKLSNTYTETDGKLDVGKLFNAKERITSKEDKKLHGYGTRTIRSAVEKHDGMIKAESEGGMYTLSLMLPRPISA